MSDWCGGRAAEYELINIELPFEGPDDHSLCMTLPCRQSSEYEFQVLEPVFLARRYLRTGDVIEVEEGEDGRYRYVRTLRTTPMRGEAFWVSRSQFESEALQELLSEVCENGGAGECLMNGILYLEMPRSSPLWNGIRERIGLATRCTSS